MQNAVSYVRVSSEDKAKHGYSIGQQITNNMTFAMQNGYKIIQTFKDEGISAKDLNRPALQELLAYCSDSRNNVKAVIIWRLDRISRSLADYVATLAPFFKQLGITIMTVSDVNGEGLQVEAMRQMSMVFAEYERKSGIIRTKEGIRGKVALGQFPHHPPIGYKNVIKDGSRYKEMVIDEDRAFYVRKIYSLCLEGDSATTIASKMKRMGLRNGKGGFIPKSSILHILHNRTYTGKFEYEGKIINGTYPVLIDEHTYLRVQKIINAPEKTRQTHTQFPYNECMKCSVCGCAMTGEIKKRNNKNGTTREYIYYHCTGNKGGNCKRNSYISQSLIDEAFITVLKQINIPERLLEAVKKGLKEAHERQGTDTEFQKKSIRARIDKIDKNVREAIESGMAKNSSVKSSIEMWENERNMLLLEEQDLFNATKTFYEQSNTLLEFCKDCHRAFLKGNAEQKRTIVKIVCSNVFYDGGNLTIALHPAFESIVKMNLSNKKLPRLDSNQQPTG